MRMLRFLLPSVVMLASAFGVANAVPPVSFTPKMDFATGTYPSSVAIGDLNGDGKPDLVVAAGIGVSVLLGTGAGGFGAKSDFATQRSGWSNSVAIEDLNGDGKPDMAVAGGIGVSVLLGNGDGTFAAASEYASGGGPRTLAIEDLNGDGKPDLVVANGSPSAVSVLLGNGDGTFAAKSDYATASSPYVIAIGDLNGDGKPDLAVADASDYKFSVLLGNGDGTFGARVDYCVAESGYGCQGFDLATCMAIGDLNADGRLDFAVAYMGVEILVWLGNGDGTFGSFTGMYGVGSPGDDGSMAILDLNGDGKPDLAKSDAFSGGFSVVLGNGDGTFGAGGTYRAGDYSRSLAIGDLNGDGKPDAAVANWASNTVSVWLNTTASPITFTDINAGLAGVRSGSVAWGDYDNDADLDILLVGMSDEDAISRVYRNDGDGVFTDINAGLPGVEDGSVAWGDFDNDGDLDIVLTGASGPLGTGRIARVYRNDGAGHFADMNIGLPGVQNGSTAWGDYDNDGDLDLLLVGEAEGGPITRVYRNDGRGAFADVDAGLPGAGNCSAVWADYDNDGRLDISVGTRLYHNRGDGVFPEVDTGLPAMALSWAAWGDYDNDGYLDVVVIGNLQSSVLHNDGDGTFTDINVPLPYLAWSWVGWGDYDNDGYLDIAVIGYPASSVHHNNGDGTFTSVSVGLDGMVADASAAWGDYDNDGDLDILLTGQRPDGPYAGAVFRSAGAPANMPPTAPSGLGAQVVGDSVTFSWDASTDLQTPPAGLSYNLRIGTTPGGSEITSPMSNAANGYRRVVQLGNAQTRTRWTVKLPPGPKPYFWSVQAVDGAYAGSSFAPERLFVGQHYENIAVSTAPGDQVSPRLVSDGARGAIVVWEDNRGGNWDVYAQRVLDAGRVDARWPEHGRALCIAPGDQTGPRIVPDGAGGAIVTWEDSRNGEWDIYAQHVLASGELAPGWPGDGFAVCRAAGDQRHPDIASDGAGGAIVAWQDSRGSEQGIYAQRVLASGEAAPDWPPEGADVGVGYFYPFEYESSPLVVEDGAGGAIVVFRSGGIGGIVAQHVLSFGALDPAWPAEGVSTLLGRCRAVVTDGAGGALVAGDRDNYMHGTDVSVLHIDASGALDQPFRHGYVYGANYARAMASDGAGGAVLTWLSGWYMYGPPPTTIAAARIPASPGDSGWQCAPYYSYPACGIGGGDNPVIASDFAGGALVAWELTYPGWADIYVQHVLRSGDMDPECPAGGRRVASGSSPQIVADGAGGGVLVWQNQIPGATSDIWAARLLGPYPTPVLAALVSADATVERARLVWNCGGSAGLSVTIYRRTEASAWQSIGNASPDGTGHLVFVDRDVSPGTRYGYRLGILEGGAEAFRGETWLTIPMTAELALRGLQPNPAVGSVSVAFSLKDDGPAELELLDVSGRRVFEKQVGALGPGAHVVRLEEGSRLSPGVYVVRLTHGGRTLVARGVLVK